MRDMPGRRFNWKRFQLLSGVIWPGQLCWIMFFQFSVFESYSCYLDLVIYAPSHFAVTTEKTKVPSKEGDEQSQKWKRCLLCQLLGTFHLTATTPEFSVAIIFEHVGCDWVGICHPCVAMCCPTPLCSFLFRTKPFCMPGKKSFMVLNVLNVLMRGVPICCASETPIGQWKGTPL